MTHGTATFVKNMQGWRGDARMYRVDPPVEVTQPELLSDAVTSSAHYDYVIVSAADVPFSGPETYIFPADTAVATQPVDWNELPGSIRGVLDHTQALHGAGYRYMITDKES